MSLEMAGFILRSEYRRKVFQILKNPTMPSKIAKETGIRLTHITRELRFLKEKKLIECLNPKEKTGRLYRLTQKGEKLMIRMKKEKLI